MDKPVNALTIDVEEHFQVSAFRDHVSTNQWDSLESRVERNTDRLLEIFAHAGVRGTFFILGWVAERYPALIRRIQAAGHELGCHSYAHRLVYELSPEEFRADTYRAVSAIGDACGVQVRAYRAPSFSVTARSLWALDILAELGFSHDSSIFPIRHDVYGLPQAPAGPFKVNLKSGALVEFPISTVEFLSQRFPISGGGYLRILPLALQYHGLRTIQRMGSPFILYLHPWEIDPQQPRINAKLKSRLRHYSGLGKTESRLRSLLSTFTFGTLTDSLAQLSAFPTWNPALLQADRDPSAALRDVAKQPANAQTTTTAHLTHTS